MRLFAALMVFFYHASAERLNGQWLSGIGSFGHDAVIVFFVLSGFVIAYITNQRSSDISSFIKSRLARLYSVAIPALLFTVVADNVGIYLTPDIYLAPYYQDSYPLARFVHNLFFINELWFTSWRAFSNGPFWSLSYEFFTMLYLPLPFI
ncbi:acyltransferase family protein [Rheinheimera sp. MA13]|uniref:Acyltransferase family protein n=1 Tax=Rheinheimera maricola TaxID=2793282 RepID=A0ABS7X7N7_9GAMM|nr:acyltransferase family protein [Rheinheimera maricola]